MVSIWAGVDGVRFMFSIGMFQETEEGCYFLCAGELDYICINGKIEVR